MGNLIKDDALAPADDWVCMEEDGATTAELPAGKLLVPLQTWLRQHHALLLRGLPCGVWLAADDDPEALTETLSKLALIAIRFPVFSDGRGYSSARILRERLGWRGELRAMGDVLRDQLFLMRRCGFDSFLVREDHDAAAALAGLRDFAHVYQQATLDPSTPLLQRGRDSA
jgi:uncharacterized protein (DUF934 family)